MRLPFFQQRWFDIDLAKLSDSLNLDSSKVGEENLYKGVYESLERDNYSALSEEYLKNKRDLANLLGELLSQYQTKEKSILSVGCGLGVVESELLQKGYKIDLQECQPLSLRYLEKNAPDILEHTRVIISSTLEKIPAHAYDAVMAITSSYCLKEEILKLFFSDIERILRPHGVFIFYEASLTWREIFNYMKQRLLRRKNTGILFGWKRSLTKFHKIAQSRQFLIEREIFLDRSNREVQSKKLFGAFLNPNVTWQLLVYKKND